MLHKFAVFLISVSMKYNTKVELLPNTPLSYMSNSDIEESAVYGLELLLNSVINLIIICSLGIVFQKLPQTLVFLFCFCTIRPYAGGYHAPNYLLCTLTFITLYCVMILNNFVVNGVLAVVLFGISAGIIWVFSPVEDLNKPLGKERRRMVQRKARVLLLAVLIAFIITKVIHYKMINTYITYAVCMVAFLMLAGMLKLYRTRDKS